MMIRGSDSWRKPNPKSGGGRSIPRHLILLFAAVCVGQRSLVGSSAYAQTPFPNRDTFLAADPGTVRAALSAVSLTDSNELDREVRSAIPAVSRFFQVSPDVFWADGQGSSSHPTAGVALDRQRLVAMREQLGASDFSDVVLFILAHEFAHMGQFRQYSLTSLHDVGKLKAVECQADLWAGAMMINYLMDSSLATLGPTKPSPAVLSAELKRMFARVNQALALAYQIGTPVWDDPTTHPLPSKRGVCVSRGVNGGLHMRLVHSYEQTHVPALLDQINEWRTKDPRLFGPGADLWAWTNSEAKAIVEYEGDAWIPPGGRPDLLGGIARLTASAQRGVAPFRSEAKSLALPGGDCALAEDAAGVELTCRYSIYVSAQMQRDGYNNWIGMVRGIVLPKGWREKPEKTSTDGSLRTLFFSPDSQSSVEVYFVSSSTTPKDVLVAVAAWKD